MTLSASSNNGRSGGKKPTYRKAAAFGADAKEAKAERAEKPARGTKPAKPEGPRGASGDARDSKDARENAEAKPAAKESSGARHAAHAKDAGGKKASAAERAEEDGSRPASKPRTPEASASKPRTPEASTKKRRRPVGVIVAAALVATLVVVGVGFGVASQGDATDAVEDAPALEFSDPGYNDAGELVNPVDWDEWVGRNPDVYAWLRIDGTKVDHPILQHPVVDDYYLMRNIDGEPEVNGTLYTQVSHNGKDFEEDPVTVVYGHTFEQNDTMFTTLHNLEDPDAFEATPTFCVYTPEKRLEYEIVSAFEYDNSHILEVNDMTDPEARAKFFDMVQSPGSINQNVRQLDHALDPDKDKLLVLSTCTQPANDSARYLVVAVLRDVEKTENVDIADDEGVLEEHVFTQEELDALADAE